MCHPELSFESGKGGWLVFQAARVVGVQRVTAHASTTVVTGKAAGGTTVQGSPNTTTKWCLCSPSQHPGSFRCRQHHANYVWRSSARASAGSSSRRRDI